MNVWDKADMDPIIERLPHGVTGLMGITMTTDLVGLSRSDAAGPMHPIATGGSLFLRVRSVARPRRAPLVPPGTAPPVATSALIGVGGIGVAMIR
jgi:hypothetical protein